MNFDPSYSARNFASVGTRPIRPDGVDKVTGRARYGADFNMAGQLVGRVLRSPHAHAKIKKIDTSKAEKLTGVKAVITAADLPDLTNGDAGMYDILDNCMARTKALYDGHAVAAVAAVDARTARQALKLIEVDYELLPHVTDVDEAMKHSAPLINDAIFTEDLEEKPVKPSNVTKRSQFGHGDVHQGFGHADFIVERSFKTEQTHQGYIEPHACVASVSSDGTADLWVCTQGHFVYRQHCAQLLGLDVSKLRVTSSEIGGGFGGKTHVWAEPVALALSRKAGRPVKLRRGVPCLGADKCHLDRRQDRRPQGRHDHRGRGDAALFVRALCRHVGGTRRHDRVRLLQARERQDGRLRSAGQPAEDGGLSRAVGTDGGLRGGKRSRRVG